MASRHFFLFTANIKLDYLLVYYQVDHFESQKKKISSFENTGFLNKTTRALTFKKHNFLEGEVGAFLGLI